MGVFFQNFGIMPLLENTNDVRVLKKWHIASELLPYSVSFTSHFHVTKFVCFRGHAIFFFNSTNNMSACFMLNEFAA